MRLKRTISSLFLVCIISTLLFLYIFEAELHIPLTSQSYVCDVNNIIFLAGNFEERSPKVIELYHKEYSRSVLLTNDGVCSRWSKKHQRNLFNIEWTEEILTQSGIPASSIVKLPYSASGTVHDARAVRTYLASHPANSLLLVTSDYHANRALWIFKQVLGDMPVRVEVAPVRSGWSSTIPILLEPLKTVYYRVRYGLLEKL